MVLPYSPDTKHRQASESKNALNSRYINCRNFQTRNHYEFLSQTCEEPFLPQKNGKRRRKYSLHAFGDRPQSGNHKSSSHLHAANAALHSVTAPICLLNRAMEQISGIRRNQNRRRTIMTVRRHSKDFYNYHCIYFLHSSAILTRVRNSARLPSESLPMSFLALLSSES